MDMTELLRGAVEASASDLHLSAGMPPLLRVDGDLIHINVPPLSSDEVLTLVNSIMSEAQQNAFKEQWEIDFSYEIPELARFRCNIFQQRQGPAAVLRVIAGKVKTLEQLNLPEQFARFCDLTRGLVLVTGPTGSGKSTTLAAMIEHINQTQPAHILTIEDPIEFVYKSQKSLINQRELGANTKSFSSALRSALREDPDVILIGEMRDLETIRLALTAAETGHLVFGTLHTASAPKTINRIIDVFPGDEKGMIRSLLAESLQAVIAQVLVKRVDQGRAAAHEIMLCTPAVRNLIREDKIAQINSTIQTGAEVGMCTLERSLKNLLEAGAISQEEADAYLK